MGYFRHHAIVVTGWGDYVEKAHDVAKAMFRVKASPLENHPICPVTDLTDEVVNGYRSFAIMPDGSKEGWDTSDQGEEVRADYVTWLRKTDEVDWAEVQLGDEEHDNRVTAHSRDEHYTGEE